jgi:uncharacterized protein YndB with AHSA1/START domain
MAEFAASIETEATPEFVFLFLTTNDGMTAWMGQWAGLDPEPGGQFAVDIFGSPVGGEFLEVDPPHCVVVSWGLRGQRGSAVWRVHGCVHLDPRRHRHVSRRVA